MKFFHWRVAALRGVALWVWDSSSHTECRGLSGTCVRVWTRNWAEDRNLGLNGLRCLSSLTLAAESFEGNEQATTRALA
jgi:hypothetical protein